MQIAASQHRTGFRVDDPLARRARRLRVLRYHGARDEDLPSLLRYGTPAWDVVGGLARQSSFPWPDESSANAWGHYAKEAGREGVAATLTRIFVQLDFPVEVGMSARPAYRYAMRTGLRAAGPGLVFMQPDRLRLELHATAAGRIPVISTPCRADFIRLTQALTRHNEPRSIPDSMGACMISGYTNWRRHHDLTDGMQKGATEKDRFILLTEGNYSNVAGEALGLDFARWRSISRTIRLEHEAAHYVTRRVFGSMRSCAHDEVLADFAGIVKATGAFLPQWALRFLGLDDLGGLSPAARLRNYRGAPPLQDSALEVIARVAAAAITRIAQFDEDRHVVCRTLPREEAWIATLAALASVSLEEMTQTLEPSALMNALTIVAEQLLRASAYGGARSP